jgi:hypothetical protein
VHVYVYMGEYSEPFRGAHKNRVYIHMFIG